MSLLFCRYPGCYLLSLSGGVGVRIACVCDGDYVSCLLRSNIMYKKRDGGTKGIIEKSKKLLLGRRFRLGEIGPLELSSSLYCFINHFNTYFLFFSTSLFLLHCDDREVLPNRYIP